MQLLFVSDFTYNPNSGAAGSLITIGHSIEKHGHKVDYIWAADKKKIRSYNVFRFIELPFIQYSQIKDALNKNQYDVVIISQPYSWWAVKKLSNKYPRTLFLNRSHGWELRIAPVTWKLDIHSTGVVRDLKNGVSLWFLKQYCYYAVKYHDAVICASSNDSDFIKEDYPQLAHKVFEIGYGLDKNYLNLGIDESIPERLKFLFAGQYVARKGILDLIFVFRQLVAAGADFELTFIIDAESGKKAREDFGFIPRANLHVISWVERKQLIDLYRQHHVFLMPSYGEGFGKTTLEAMACGLCCVGYSEGALKDLGKHNINALISQTGDVEDLTENIRAALANPALVKQLGKQAYIDVQNETWEKNAVTTLELIGSLKKR